MKHLLPLCVATLLMASPLRAAERLDLKSLTSGKFTAETLSAVTPLSDGESYAQISKDGREVQTFSFKTGKQLGVLFDVGNTIGEKIDDFDNYILSPDATKMLIQTRTERIYRHSFKAVFYIYTIATRKLERLSDYGPQQAPVWSRDGHQVAFVRDNNIYLVKLLYGNAESQVTKDGKFNEIINGIPDWVNEEEFGFNSAMTFNADGTMLCWIKYDESAVKTYGLQLFMAGKDSNRDYEFYPGMYAYKYPKAGQDNAKVSAWSYDIQSHQTRRIDLPLATDGYIPRIKATAQADKVILLTMNRHQDELNVYAANPRSTVCQLLIRESVPKYVKEEVLANMKITDSHILLPSDRDGFMHLYLYDMTGKLQLQIVRDRYDVTRVYGFDEASGNVYYQAAALGPQDRQVYVCTKNGKITRLSDKEGTNNAIFAAHYKYFLNIWSDRNTPYVYTLCNADGKTLATLIDNANLRRQLAGYGLSKKETFSFTTSEGVQLNGWMVKPADFNPSKKYPVVMFQYSGPGSQQVLDSWSIGAMGQGGIYEEYLAQQGFIFVCVDGRGTGARGAEFEKCTYLRLGDLESKDQVETALWLGKQSYVNKDRIGIWGWSFGGFNTLMSMSEGRQVFRAGVAVAPPTSWKYYDTIYTERYMRTPKENPSGYDVNPIARANNLSGALLICQGLSDDNVHPQNAIEYAEALVEADKDFREIFYANKNHSIYGGNTRNHLFRQITDFFEEELMRK